MRQAKFLDFPLEEYAQRLQRLRELIEEAKLDALLLTMRDNVEYLSGFKVVSWRLPDKRFWLVVPLQGNPVLTVDTIHEYNARETSWIEDVRIWGKDGRSYIDHIIDIVQDLRLSKATIGMELGDAAILHMSQHDYFELVDQLNEVRFVDAAGLLSRARMVKSSLEIDRISRACRITCEGYKKGFSSIVSGMTEKELLRVIACEWIEQGAEPGYTSTNPGYLAVNSGRIMQVNPFPEEQEIKMGELIQVDGGAVYKGYCADIYRNAFVGEPPEKLVEYSSACSNIIDSTLARIMPGITSSEISETTNYFIREMGLENNRRMLMDAISLKKGSTIGHGLGFGVHELPFICPDDDTVWEAGMCGALELGIGDEVHGYLQWEDNFVVLNDGVKVLSPMEKKLWVVGI
jgi:Xaa-Pro aminopeptidase